MDIYSIYQEAHILMSTVYGGILIGFIYDIYRVTRRFFKPKKLATMIQDFVFWILISIVALYVLIISNQGDIRYYNFIGFILGSTLYQLLLSKIIIKYLVIITKSIKNFLHDIYQIAVYPFKVGLCLLMGPYSYCKTKVKPLYYKTRRLSKLPLNIIKDTKKTIKIYLKKK